METNNGSVSSPRASAKDFFLNLGAIVALYTVVISLINLLFTVINVAYPQITNGYNYYGSQSISWPVAMLIIFFPIFIVLMWLLERGYAVESEKRYVAVKRWLTYITLFIAGLALAIDLVTVLYYFLDGQELTTAFLLKILVVLLLTLGVFLYFITETRDKLTPKSRKIWLTVAILVILASIVWGFAVLGSPMTQRYYKYDQQKIFDLQNINSEVMSYYSTKGGLPDKLTDLSSTNNYYVAPNDPQTGQPYEYVLVGQSAKAYQLCATFNKDSQSEQNVNSPMILYPVQSWAHPAGHYCFTETIPVNQYVKPASSPVM